MPLNFADISKYQGDPDLGALDGVFINFTPQNSERDAQLAKAQQEGKLIAGYWWPGAVSTDPHADAQASAAYVESKGGGIRVYLDLEDASIGPLGSDPVGWSTQWHETHHELGHPTGDYLEAHLLTGYGWQRHVDLGVDLWLASWGSFPATVAPWPFATAWQNGNHEPTTGGDPDVVYCDIAGWHKLAGTVAPDITPEPAPAPPAPVAPVQVPDTVYTVATGDTLGGIAARFGTTYQFLAQYNGITNPNLIFPGQQIKVPEHRPSPAPAPAPAPAPPAEEHYTIASGDTLGAIAARFGTTVDELVALNQPLITNPDFIEAGWTIRVR